jgi:hypothetical protein
LNTCFMCNLPASTARILSQFSRVITKININK